MERPRGWGAEQTGREPMRSPGRPGVNQRGTKQTFWKHIAEGMESEAAALACGVSQPLGPRWFREAGGMAPISLLPHSGRYLSFTEREELALLRIQGHGAREIARLLDRSPSTISRELRRNAATRGGTLEYRATVAQWKAERAAKRPKITKLSENKRLRTYVQARLEGAVTGYDVLERTQKGELDITRWQNWFLECLLRAIESAHGTLGAVLDKARFWERFAREPLNARQIKVLNRLLDGFEGKLTTSKWARIAKCSQDTAYRDILDLMERGALKKDAAGGRSTSYSLAGGRE